MVGSSANTKSRAYGAGFYKDRRAKTLHSAHRVLGLLFDTLPISSVVDFGCGTATWLSVARELGAERILGIEGDWLDRARLDIPAGEFKAWELEKPLKLGERFDLAISLEVAEHLTKARAQSFVDDLCHAADCVLFSAAIPGQGGELHINEQWQSEWAKCFAENDYRPVDMIRPSIWHDPMVPYWYRQNILVYATDALADALRQKTGAKSDVSEIQMDIVHPDLFMEHAPFTARLAFHKALRIPRRILRKFRENR